MVVNINSLIFAENQTTSRGQMKTTDDFEDYLNIHEFYELMWDRVSEELISNMYIDENSEFIKEITFNLFNEYKEDRITLNLAARLTENYVRSMFKHKPNVSNIVDNKFLD